MPGHGAVTAVYRIFMLDADDYGLPGRGLLTDQVGRPIALTEGFVLRRPATAITDMGITEDHLDRARTLVIPAYRAFWAQGGSYRRRDSAPFALTSAARRARRVVLKTCPPWAPDAVPAGTASAGASAAPPKTRVPVVTSRTAGGSRRPAARLRHTVIVILAVIVLAWVIRALTAGPAAATAGQTMSKLCDALRSGRPAAGYALTTAAYQKQVPENDFASELLPAPDAAGAQCTYRVQKISGSGTAQASMTITARGAAPATWVVSLDETPGSSWEVSAFSRAAATRVRPSGPGPIQRNGPAAHASRG